MAQDGHHPLELKSPAEIDRMRKGGRILASVMRQVCLAAVEGVTTNELDALAHARIREAKAKPAFLGLYGFPKTLCISLNEEIVHGIPGKRALRSGDIVSIDCGVLYDGLYTDMAYTVAVGEVPARTQELLKATRASLYAALDQCRPGNRLGDIGFAVESTVKPLGFHVVEDYGGHGIGRHLHEDPRIENYGEQGKGKRLAPGMVFAVEPMVAIGTGANRVLGDAWTVVTQDGSPAAHFEHTVAIRENGPEILTLWDEEI